MGFFLRKNHHPVPELTIPQAGKKLRPSIHCLRGRLIEFRERLWFIQWDRNGRSADLAGIAKAIVKRFGKDKTCSCDRCALRTETIFAVLAWAVGETEDLE